MILYNKAQVMTQFLEVFVLEELQCNLVARSPIEDELYAIRHPDGLDIESFDVI